MEEEIFSVKQILIREFIDNFINLSMYLGIDGVNLFIDSEWKN